MTVSEAHYELWDRIICLVDDHVSMSLRTLKQKAAAYMDLTTTEKEILAENQYCALCSVTSRCVDCPLGSCGDNSLYKRFVFSLSHSDWGSAREYALRIRDIPLPGRMDGELADLYAEAALAALGDTF